jgi:hypothetical protein
MDAWLAHEENWLARCNNNKCVVVFEALGEVCGVKCDGRRARAAKTPKISRVI